ncbi:MAG TPA: phosphoribosylaminoimidazolesuccinocarboxamide synthase [Candidatus Alistipes avicola]|uniref:Phosphoribosylaminoimidazole-succinocarboxamide synthase n=1 Tax=Candidatus Alistipes avicola TaxID=2838432 RepID=A0A9D2IDP4_9BACT|nr:phosphoribosylaminoimidazolesuccinocarboxamide synthase [uncultured Alistipes sp.]HJA98448.1 phosphoribosylaminoimidazolesuccinocarboxamide synthase [Candidatus Alistipes avicola]
MQQREILYEGKTKQLFQTEDPELILIHYMDTATAFNNIKLATIENKGILNNKISSLVFEYLAQKGIRTHYVKMVGDRDQLCRRVRIIPLEVIVRNVIAGSMAHRLGLEEGTKPSNVIFDICYKNDDLGDPLINDHHAVALGLVSYDELNRIYAMASEINHVLIELFDRVNITLVDFKVEFGYTPDGEIVLADEISPDTSRLWDKGTNERLDRDRFRRDMGRIREAYGEILARLERVIEKQ